jgi:hypothetical protein
MSDPNYHPNLHLLALERTGWRRWIFGRWVYSCEAFRRDIQRACARSDMKTMKHPWEQMWHPNDDTLKTQEAGDE